MATMMCKDVINFMRDVLAEPEEMMRWLSFFF